MIDVHHLLLLSSPMMQQFAAARLWASPPDHRTYLVHRRLACSTSAHISLTGVALGWLAARSRT